METSRTTVPWRRWNTAGTAGLGLVLFSFGVLTNTAACGAAEDMDAPAAEVEVPTYELDPSFPKPLPNNWTLGETWGVAVDSRDHPWIVQSTNHHANFPPGQSGDIFEVIAQEGKTQPPPVIEFDPQGNFVQAWGGPGSGYSWPEGRDWASHGMWIDRNDDVWVAGNGHVVLKFTSMGEFLLQIGKLWHTGGSYDQELLGKPTTMATDQDATEVYVADGYYNQRVAVFDATTGAYKRQFGAYGKPHRRGVRRDGGLRVAHGGGLCLQPAQFAGRRGARSAAGPPVAGALREGLERRLRLCLRPQSQPDSGFQDRRHLRRRGVPRQGGAGPMGVGLRG